MKNEMDISKYKLIFENIKIEVAKSQYKTMQAITKSLFICTGI